jgi:hypothetical protein
MPYVEVLKESCPDLLGYAYKGRQVVFPCPLCLVKICKEVAKKEGDLMKPRGLAFVVLAILIVTALSAAVATAQSGPQGTQSGDLAMPIDVAGSSPTQIDAHYDTGNKITTYMPGQTNTNSSQQTADPQRKQPRERPARNNKDNATPTEAAPSAGNSINPGSGGGSSGPIISSGSPLKELPKTGGPGM